MKEPKEVEWINPEFSRSRKDYLDEIKKIKDNKIKNMSEKYRKRSYK